MPSVTHTDSAAAMLSVLAVTAVEVTDSTNDHPLRSSPPPPILTHSPARSLARANMAPA